MKLVKIEDRWINPDHVTSIGIWDESRTIIRMVNDPHIIVEGKSDDIAAQLNKGARETHV